MGVLQKEETMTSPALILTAMISLCAGTAIAACPDKSASQVPDSTQTAGISKDGTHAPLESPNSPTQDRKDSAQKDGSTMPLASKEGGGDKNLATSQQDVEAQQQGEKTATAQARDKCKD
jgi:hypothetical protein